MAGIAAVGAVIAGLGAELVQGSVLFAAAVLCLRPLTARAAGRRLPVPAAVLATGPGIASIYLLAAAAPTVQLSALVWAAVCLIAAAGITLRALVYPRAGLA